MMHMKAIRHILVAVAGFCLVSCEGFFSQFPSNSITTDNFYRTETDFDQAVRGCYARLKTGISFYVKQLAYKSDECSQVQMGTSNQDLYYFDHFEETSSTGLISDIWNQWYIGVYRCNDVLNHLEGKDFAKAEQFKGEALFLRSWFYFNLYRSFGVVPLTTVVVSPKDALTVPRCTSEQMLERLETDLKEAADCLPKSRGDEKARVTKIAAQALLGKVYLTFGKYPEADVVLEEAMKDTGFGLLNNPADVFKVENKLNKEIIFAVHYNKTNNTGHSFWWMTTNDNTDRPNPTEVMRALFDPADKRLPLVSKWVELKEDAAYNGKPRYVLQKFYDNYDQTYIEVVGNDWPHIRYADVILMRAEALAMQNRLGDALVYLNKTRTRAGLAALSAVGDGSKEAFIQELADERGREFALEGQRWYDLVRLGLAYTYFKYMGYDKITENKVIFPIPNDQIEIVNDDKILWQNPGH